MKHRLPLLWAAAALLSLSPLAAQGNRPSPTATVDAAINGHNLKIVYARPYTKDPRSGEMRKIWDGLVPYGRVWRTGANEATTLTTDTALVFSGTTIPAGTYTLFSIPTATGGQLVINKQTGQWGTRYEESQDLARVPMMRHAASGDPVHQFTIEIDAGDNGGAIKLIWEDAVYMAHFTFGS